MKSIDPEPPHISVSVYTHVAAEDDVFWNLHELVMEHGASSVCMDLAPVDRVFESVSDLVGTLSSVIVDDPKACRSRQEEANARAVSAFLSHSNFGPVVVKYEKARVPDRHPVSVVLGAGSLGIPADFWPAKDRAEAKRLASWAIELLRAACARIDPLYGGLAIENTLPGPRDLVEKGRIIRGGVYLSRQVVGRNEGFLASIRTDYGDGVVSEWPNGYYVSGWASFNERGASAADNDELTRRVNRFLVNRARFS